MVDECVEGDFWWHELAQSKSNLIRWNYRVGCWHLPWMPPRKKIQGLKNTYSIYKENELTFYFPRECAPFVGYCIYINFGQENPIDEVIFNGRLIKSLTVENLETNSWKTGNSIKLRYRNADDARCDNDTLFYLISPFRDDGYYMDQFLDELRKSSGR